MNDGKKIDFYIILLLIGTFAVTGGMAFFAREHLMENIIMLAVLFGMMMSIYFTGIMAGIVLDAMCIFIYVSIGLYRNFFLGVPFGNHIYAWVFIILYQSFVVGMLHKYVYSLQEHHDKLLNEYKDLVTIDGVTRLDNEKAFIQELSQLMSISRRNNLPLTLMIIRIHHFQQINRIIGPVKMQEVVRSLSESISSLLRQGDKCFALDSRDTFASLLFTNHSGAEVAKERLKNEIRLINLKMINKDINVNVEIKIGLLEYDKDKHDILSLKELAEKELEYDV